MPGLEGTEQPEENPDDVWGPPEGPVVDHIPRLPFQIDDNGKKFFIDNNGRTYREGEDFGHCGFDRSGKPIVVPGPLFAMPIDWSRLQGQAADLLNMWGYNPDDPRRQRAEETTGRGDDIQAAQTGTADNANNPGQPPEATDNNTDSGDNNSPSSPQP